MPVDRGDRRVDLRNRDINIVLGVPIPCRGVGPLSRFRSPSRRALVSRFGQRRREYSDDTSYSTSAAHA